MSANPSADAESRAISDLKEFIEAERAGRPFVLFRDREDRQRLFFFPPASRAATVGRLPSCDIVIDWDSQVSRSHARFEQEQDGWTLVDEGMSSNGTFVNDQRLDGRRRLRDGDTLRFGATTVAFHSGQPSPSSAARPDPAAAAVSPIPGVDLSSTQRRILIALCRPYKGRSGFASPAGDQQIADELFLSPGEVRAHLRVLEAKLGLTGAPSETARVALVERAFAAGLITESDL